MQFFMKTEDKRAVEDVETTGERCCHKSCRTPLNRCIYIRGVYIPMYLRLTTFYKNPPPNVISPIGLYFCYFYFALGLHP